MASSSPHSDFRLILGSASPRRKQLLEEMGFRPEVSPVQIEEKYPPRLVGREISEYLAVLKADAFDRVLEPDQWLITSDTVVWHRGSSLEKPANRLEAIEMLTKLNNDWHEVITSVCLRGKGIQKLDSCITRVLFRNLSKVEIAYYVDQFEPFDKAGAYGIQEWLGLIGVEEIRGSYSNVVGLPTHLLYQMLNELPV